MLNDKWFKTLSAERKGLLAPTIPRSTLLVIPPNVIETIIITFRANSLCLPQRRGRDYSLSPSFPLAAHDPFLGRSEHNHYRMRNLPLSPNLLLRRGRDSNPRYCFTQHTRFPGVHLRPLGHLSL